MLKIVNFLALFDNKMRVFRIKHRAGLAVFVVILLVLLFVLISKHSRSEVGVNEESLYNIPTRTVDFINIASNVAVEGDNLQDTPLVRGKVKSNFRKQPRPPKRRISDGKLDRAVIKNVVHGDTISGPSKDSNRHQRHKARPLESNHNDKKGILFLSLFMTVDHLRMKTFFAQSNVTKCQVRCNKMSGLL